MFSKPKKLTSPPIKAHVSLSHIKTRHRYDFPLYFPREFLKKFISVYEVKMTIGKNELPQLLLHVIR